MPCISIIVPVYNVEQYLPRCIDSILAQTFRDFELILVDDGSPDNCGAICDAYAEKDSRIHVIHKTNGGVSSARNAGLDAAAGKYIGFVDSDDYLPFDALESLYAKAEEYHADLTVGAMSSRVENVGRKIYIDSIPYGREEHVVCKGDLNWIRILWEQNNMLSSCAKLYRKEIIENINIRFNRGLVVLEDFDFVLQFVDQADRFVSVTEIVYCVFNTSQENSVLYRARADYSDDIVSAHNKFMSFLMKNHEKAEGLIESVLINCGPAISSILLDRGEDWKEKLRKYRNLGKVLKEPVFREFTQMTKYQYSRFEYFCRLHGFGLGIWLHNRLKEIV